MTISEVAAKFNLTPDTLRYYEKVGLLKAHRKESGVRDYTDQDIERIEFVTCMRKSGLSIEFLQRYLQLLEQGDGTKEERKKILLEQREILLEKMKQMQETLDRLNYKIEKVYAASNDCPTKEEKK